MLSRASDRRRHEKSCKGRTTDVTVPPSAKKKAKTFIKMHKKKCPKCGLEYLTIREHKEGHDCKLMVNYVDLAAWYCDVCKLFFSPLPANVKRHKKTIFHRKNEGQTMPVPTGPRKNLGNWVK